VSETLQASDLDARGAEYYPAQLPHDAVEALRTLADQLPASRAGVRLTGGGALSSLLGPVGSIGRLARTIQGEAAQPVRIVLFDKSAAANWMVPWHQDRTIAVRSRCDVPGFGPWSTKAGMHHVEPPFGILAAMITLRVHLDDCDADNAPLLIVPGSHRLGRVPAGETAACAQSFGHVVCMAQVDDIWAYATPILHASERARRPSRRRVLQVDYAAIDLPGGLEWLGVDAE